MAERTGSECPPIKTGDVLGSMVVVGLDGFSKYRQRLWRCRCLVCGHEAVRKKWDFSRSRSLGQPGCERCRHKAIKGSGSSSWRGYGELPRSYFGSVTRGAAGRGIGFDVTIEYAWELFLKQGRRCALTGDRLVMPGQVPGPDEKVASLDRIDSFGYYRPGNVQWTSVRSNLMKGDMPEDEFVRECDKVVKHSKRKK